MRNSNIVSKFLTVVMVLECVVIAVLVLVIFNVYSRTTYDYQDEQHFFYSLESESYAEMVQATYTNRFAGVRMTGDMEEMYGVGDYVYAASLYRVYESAGDADRAKEYMERMEDAYDEMGIYAVVANTINQRLGITDFDK